MVFQNRHDAGKALGNVLATKYKRNNTVVLALPRGGVPVGFEVSQALQAPLEVVISKKLGAPNNPEFGIGAVAEEGIVTIHEPTVQLFNLKQKDIEQSLDREEQEVRRLVSLYRHNRALPDFSGKVVIVVDDGLATGQTAKAALEVAERHTPDALVFAAPICELDTAREINRLVDDTHCLNSQHEIQAVSLWYQDFNQVTDEAVLSFLQQQNRLEYLF